MSPRAVYTDLNLVLVNSNAGNCKDYSKIENARCPPSQSENVAAVTTATNERCNIYDSVTRVALPLFHS